MDLIAITGYVSLALGSGLALLSRIPKQTIENQKDLIETYEKRLKALEEALHQNNLMHIENVRAIAGLQGQIDVYKELPLQDMALSMKEISEANKGIARSNDKMLEILTSSAIALRRDTEIAQTNSSNAAVAVEKVRTTLHNDDENKTRLVKTKPKE